MEISMTRYEFRQESCINSGNCVEIAPSLFTMDDDGVVSALKDSAEGADEQDALQDAADSCPVRAIVLDE
jgi:ferredoxin